MKAHTALCTAERPISNGLRNASKKSLTVSIYTGSVSLLCWKQLCLMSHLINIFLLKYCVKLFCCYKRKPLIIDMCDCLLCVEISDIKAGRLKQCWYKQKIVLIFFPVTGVSSFHLLYCCYCYYIVVVAFICIEFFLALSCVFQFTLTTKNTPQLYCYKPVTH
jgi:hypothetical protein